MIDGVQSRACRKHPSGEDPLDRPIECDLVHFDKSIGQGRLGRRARVADARRHLQRTELDGFIDVNVESDDATGDLVQTGKHSDRIADLFGCCGTGEIAAAPTSAIDSQTGTNPTRIISTSLTMVARPSRAASITVFQQGKGTNGRWRQGGAKRTGMLATPPAVFALPFRRTVAAVAVRRLRRGPCQ